MSPLRSKQKVKTLVTWGFKKVPPFCRDKQDKNLTYQQIYPVPVNWYVTDSPATVAAVSKLVSCSSTDVKFNDFAT